MDLGVDDARTDRDHPDAVGGDLLREPDGDGLHRCLGRGVVDVPPRAATLRGTAGDVDDHAAAGGPKPGHLDRAWALEIGIAYPDAARDEIAIGLRLTEHQAQTRLETARALRDRLPHTREMGLAGRLSLEHMAAMAEATIGLDADQASEVEVRVLDDERAVRPGQLGFRARAAAQQLLDAPYERRLAREATCSLDAWLDPWGQVGFCLSVPEPDAAVVDAYPSATAGRQGPDDLRPVDERRADALLELIRSALDSGTLPSGGDGRRPHLDITTTAEGLREGAWHAATIGGRFVLSGQLRELACDADVRTTVLDRDRFVVDQGHTTRVVSARLRGRLVLRDAHCRFPGCEVRAPRCRAHHIRHWADGGPTDLANLLMVCERHHHAIPQGGWSVRLELDHATWTSPLGRPIESPGDLAPPPDDLWQDDPALIRPWNEWLMVDPEPDPPADPLPVAPSVSDVCPF